MGFRLYFWVTPSVSMATGSVVVRKSLGRRLQALREGKGMSVIDVVTTGLFSKSKLQGIEKGTRPVRLADIWALCRTYGVDATMTDRLAEMAQNTSAGGWWEDYVGDLPSWFATYVELETAASRAFMYDGELIPGLLQAPRYQRAQFERYQDFTEEYAERQISMRSERQRAVFERPEPLILTAVIGQEALTRLAGGKLGMAEQKEHLLSAVRESNIEVRVLPWSLGAHAANKGAFNILDFDSSDHPSIVYLETYVGGRYVEDESIVSGFQQMAETVSAQAVPIEEFFQ